MILNYYNILFMNQIYYRNLTYTVTYYNIMYIILYYEWYGPFIEKIQLILDSNIFLLIIIF